MSENKATLVECPRDAMQGIKAFIPTELKIEYLNLLLGAGFDVLDFGSFVSPKAIPQMQDTAAVLAGLNVKEHNTRLLAIIANERGAADACQHSEISYLGYPFSISETFQQRNTNASIAESLNRVLEISRMCEESKKELVIYISMAFGNPYNDDWNADIAIKWSRELYEKTGTKILALSDTIGIANPESIDYLFRSLIPQLPDVTFGAHLHTTPETWKEKMEAAWNAGCRRFDGAIKGFGGCPMAKDDLTGNMPMEKIIGFLNENHISHNLNLAHFQEAYNFSGQVFMH